MGYRWYEANDVKPVFPFGYGLSYTTFKYDDLKVKVGRGLGPENGGQGVSSIDVSFTVTNTGDVAGAEAAQVYLTLPDEAGEPFKRLVNFEKVDLEPGESQQVTVRINQADSNHPFSYFIPAEPDNLANWADGEWATADGKYRVHVGGSSADTPLEKNITVNFKKPTAEKDEEQKREEAKKAEEQKREEAKKAEEQKREEAKKAEEQKREEAKKAEEQKREEAKKAEEQKREEAKIAKEQKREEAKKAKEQKREEAKKAEEQKHEAAKKAEEQKRENWWNFSNWFTKLFTNFQ